MGYPRGIETVLWAATPDMAIKLFWGWLPAAHRVWWALAIVKGVHGIMDTPCLEKSP
jgi:hypothetical protein